MRCLFHKTRTILLFLSNHFFLKGSIQYTVQDVTELTSNAILLESILARFLHAYA
uniref:Uncharacterized protein n=1 Tax=Rhizophora mucronata TaxID=61149 RepID=A0A2P2NCY9_RHIMU